VFEYVINNNKKKELKKRTTSVRRTRRLHFYCEKQPLSAILKSFLSNQLQLHDMLLPAKCKQPVDVSKHTVSQKRAAYEVKIFVVV